MAKPPVDKARAARAITDFLGAIGLDPASPELAETGDRVAAMFVEDLCRGYDVDLDRLIIDNRMDCKDSPMEIVVRDIAVTTTCPHHLLPASGRATVAFRPVHKIVGLGAVGDLVQACSERLILQEALGELVVDVLHRHLEPWWVACKLTLTHGCMTARGSRRHGASVDTVSVRGTVTGDAQARIFGATRGP